MKAKNSDISGETWQDYIDEYWSPKTPAGGRQIPVVEQRGKEIIDLYIRHFGPVDASHQTVRRRLTRLAELTPDIDPEGISPRSARASTPTYWISLPSFDASDLQLLMGWQHLSTAQYYFGCTQAGLRTAIQRALGIEPDPAFDVDTDPATFSELRPDDEEDRIQIETITPDYDPTRHAAPDVLHPLEDEAQALLNESSEDPTGRIKAQLPTGLAAMLPSISIELPGGRLKKEWKEEIGETGDKPGLKKATVGAVCMLGMLTWVGILMASTGVRVDPVATANIRLPSMGHAVSLAVGLIAGTTRVLSQGSE